MSADLHARDDEALARQSQAGDFAAFEELVHRYEAKVYGFVRQVSSEGDARDITQQTFVRAFQAIAQFDSRYSFASWLFTIARRKCLDHFRAKPPWEQTELPELPDRDDPAELLARQEEQQQIWAWARSHLPQIQFQALWLKYTEGMSVSEIARVLGKTQTHVKVLLFRARQRLLDQFNMSRTCPARPTLSREEIYEKLAYKI